MDRTLITQPCTHPVCMMAFHALTQWEHERRGRAETCINKYLKMNALGQIKFLQLFNRKECGRNRASGARNEPENLGRMKWPHVKTTKYKEVSCH